MDSGVSAKGVTHEAPQRRRTAFAKGPRQDVVFSREAPSEELRNRGYQHCLNIRCCQVFSYYAAQLLMHPHRSSAATSLFIYSMKKHTDDMATDAHFALNDPFILRSFSPFLRWLAVTSLSLRNRSILTTHDNTRMEKETLQNKHTKKRAQTTRRKAFCQDVTKPLNA